MNSKLTTLQKKRVKEQTAYLKKYYAKERRKKVAECVNFFIEKRKETMGVVNA